MKDYRLKHDPDWYKQAACQDHPHELFFHTGKGNKENAIRNATAICQECPALVDCRLYAANLKQHQRLYGVWAGVDYGMP